MLANSDLPERRASARSSPVVHDVALQATALDTDPKPFDLGIPDHRLPALRPGSQSVNRTLRDLVPHAGLRLGIARYHHRYHAIGSPAQLAATEDELWQRVRALLEWRGNGQ